MNFTASQIAAITEGKVEGDSKAAVSSFGKIEEAKNGQLTFLANPKYEEFIYTTRASVIIINDSQTLKKPVNATVIRVKDAYSAFAKLLSVYQKIITENLKGIQEPAYISKTATIAEDCFIGAFACINDHANIGKGSKVFAQCYIGNNVSVGEDSILYPGVKVYDNCKIGNNVIVHAGTIIGSDGFGFAPQNDGTYSKIPQIGNVIIEDNVEIGANTTIDRATIGSTIIKAGSKLDNLIQVAHNVEIGNSTVIAAQTGISGSTKIGNQVMIGGQAGLAGHIKIGNKARINAQSGVGKDVDEGKAVTGSPAYDYTSAMRSLALVKNLPELEQRITELENALKKLPG